MAGDVRLLFYFETKYNILTQFHNAESLTLCSSGQNLKTLNTATALTAEFTSSKLEQGILVQSLTANCRSACLYRKRAFSQIVVCESQTVTLIFEPMTLKFHQGHVPSIHLRRLLSHSELELVCDTLAHSARFFIVRCRHGTEQLCSLKCVRAFRRFVRKCAPKCLFDHTSSHCDLDL